MLAAVALLTAVPTALLAKGDPAAGKQKAQVCEACHGPDGKSVAPTYPHLAGQYESYLIKALADYRAGRRSNPIMAPMAANLSDQDIEDLAAWFASQDGLYDLSIQ
jgi:cytochrome c553